MVHKIWHLQTWQYKRFAESLAVNLDHRINQLSSNESPALQNLKTTRPLLYISISLLVSNNVEANEIHKFTKDNGAFWQAAVTTFLIGKPANEN